MSDHKPARETRRGKTPADRPTVTDDARAEAMSRYSFGTYHGQMVQWHDAKKLAVDAFIAGAEWAAARAETTTTEPCPDHNPVQHRDGNPPWCPRCGLTAAMTEPVSRFKRDRAERNLDLHPTGNNPIGDTK